jgi:hypothetical protein
VIENVELRGEGSHAVAKQDNLSVSTLAPRNPRDLDHVGNQGRKAGWTKVSKSAGLCGERAMAAVVIGVNVVAGAGQCLRHWAISPRMLTHAVRNLNGPAFRRGAFPPIDAYRSTIRCGDGVGRMRHRHRRFSPCWHELAVRAQARRGSAFQFRRPKIETAATLLKGAPPRLWVRPRSTRSRWRAPARPSSWV